MSEAVTVVDWLTSWTADDDEHLDCGKPGTTVRSDLQTTRSVLRGSYNAQPVM